MYTIYIELWKCDLLKDTTDDAPDGDQTGDSSAQSSMRYRLCFVTGYFSRSINFAGSSIGNHKIYL